MTDTKTKTAPPRKKADMSSLAGVSKQKKGTVIGHLKGAPNANMYRKGLKPREGYHDVTEKSIALANDILNVPEEVKEERAAKKFKPVEGVWYGQLVVKREIQGSFRYMCICICGGEVARTAIQLGKAPTCRHYGSLEAKAIKDEHTLYRKWRYSIMQPAVESPSSVCEEWRSLVQFIADTKLGFEAGCSIMPIRSEEPLSKDNYLWIGLKLRRSVYMWRDETYFGVHILSYALALGADLKLCSTYWKRYRDAKKLLNYIDDNWGETE